MLFIRAVNVMGKGRTPKKNKKNAVPVVRPAPVEPEDDEEEEQEELVEEGVDDATTSDVPEDQMDDSDDIEMEGEEEDETNDEKKFIHPELLQKRTGVLYFSFIPPKFNQARIQSYFEKLVPGKIGRIYLEKNKQSRDPENKYLEGWLEIKSRKAAKFLEGTVDGTEIGGKRNDPVSSMMWNIKYLSGFKWVHLTEQLAYEKVAHTQRMNLEISQARRVAAHFEEMVHKGKHIAELEKKVLESGGKWEKFDRKLTQKKPKRQPVIAKDDDVMKMIFQE